MGLKKKQNHSIRNFGIVIAVIGGFTAMQNGAGFYGVIAAFVIAAPLLWIDYRKNKK